MSKYSNKSETVSPKIFLTDYASYNDGSQFEFGHWVDLSEYSDIEELQEYIDQHFKEADKKSPIDEYTIREEIMITDYEGFPSEFYCESGTQELEKVFKWMELEEEDQDKIEFLCDNMNYDFEEAFDKIEDLRMAEQYDNFKYDEFDALYPEFETINNDFVSVDYNRFLEERYTEFESQNGNKYYVEDNQF